MRYKNDKQYQICHHQIRFFQAQNTPKSVFGAPDPAGGAYDASPIPSSRLGRGIPPPHSASRSTPTRFSGPPQHKILATPVVWEV